MPSGSASGLTVLRCIGSGRATKEWQWTAHQNEWRRISYQAGAFFTPTEHQVRDLAELVDALDQVRRDPIALVVRGELTPAVRAAVTANPRYRCRRRKHLKDGVAPTLLEVPRQWVMIDIDGWPLRPSDDLAEDPDGAIDHAIYELLPTAFHDAECWWQLSSSAGFVPGILKAHLFFWLTAPADNAHIKLVLKQHAPAVDGSLFCAAQAHYIADPIISDGFDPIPRRTGWRRGLDSAVALPTLKSAAQPGPDQAGTGTRGYSCSGVDPLTKLGDGPGLDGFHSPLRVATLRYARHVARHGGRDDAAEKKRLRTAMHAAPRRPERGSLPDYGDDYLQRLIDGAFALLAGNAEIQSMRPHYEPATGTVDDARKSIKKHCAEFFERAHRWHCMDPAGQATYLEHAALADAVGCGKTQATITEVIRFIAAAKAAERPHRVLWMVETHKLGNEALDIMTAAGLNAAVLRGRGADEPGTEDAEKFVKARKMCLNTDAVDDAIVVLANVEQAVCGSGRDGEPSCPWRTGSTQCAYQRQKPAAAQADVVIVAHEALFHAQGEGSGFGVVIVDEAFWQTGLYDRITNLDGFAAEALAHPVLEKGQKVQGGTAELHRIASKVEVALRATPPGAFPSKTACIEAGLTAAECRTAHKLEWRRKRDGLIHPGQPVKLRREMVAQGMANAAIPQRAAIYDALAELLEGEDTHTGRIEVGKADVPSGAVQTIILHSRKEIRASIAGLPILHLDATLPLGNVQHYLPRMTVLSAIQPVTPNMEVIQVLGAWGKRSLAPDEEASPVENRRRGRTVAEIADFMALQSAGNGGVVTYLSIEDGFKRDGIMTGHFNAIAGLDTFKKVNAFAQVGRVMLKPLDVRNLALCLTGRPIPVEAGHIETRGALMANGEGAAVQVRVYADPDLEAIRAAITDEGSVQVVGRCRAVNRTQETRVKVFIFADGVLPIAISRIVQWADIKPNVVERMAGRGLILFSPADAAMIHPDLFLFRDGREGSEEAAKKALVRGEADLGDSPLSKKEGFLLLKGSPPNQMTLAACRT